MARQHDWSLSAGDSSFPCRVQALDWRLIGEDSSFFPADRGYLLNEQANVNADRKQCSFQIRPLQPW